MPPTIITIGSASAKGFGFGASAAGATNWLGVATGVTNLGTGYGINRDTSDNLYMTGGGPSGQWWLAKISPSGSVLWQRISPGSVNGYGYCPLPYSTTDLIVTGISGPSVSVGYPTYLLVNPSTGALTTQAGIANSVSGGALAQSVMNPSNGNWYTTGSFPETTGNYNFHLYRLSVGGSFLLKRYQASLVGNGYGLSLDSSENLFFCVVTNTDVYYFKYASDLTTVVWGRTGTLASFTAKSSAQASSSVYCAGYDGFNTTTAMAVAKLSSTGTYTWSRRLGGQAAGNGFFKMALDSSENTYAIGVISGVCYIAKYDSSGNLTWQRSITTGAAISQNPSISLSSDQTKFYFACYNSASNLFFGKLPVDGSLTGSYTVGGLSFTYAASSLTGTNTTITNSAASNILSTSTKAVNSPSVTFSASSRSVSFLTL